jgi:hypothetical protein
MGTALMTTTGPEDLAVSGCGHGDPGTFEMIPPRPSPPLLRYRSGQ